MPRLNIKPHVIGRARVSRPRLAVYVASSEHDDAYGDPAPAPRTVSKPLWADKPLRVSQGRLLAVRKVDNKVQVALRSPRFDELRWVSAESVLTDEMADSWVQSSRFTPA